MSTGMASQDCASTAATSAGNAAEARWAAAGGGNGGGDSLLPKETHEGAIRIGNREIPCSVLDNELRVFSTRGINRAMGSKRTGAPETAKNGAPQLPSFLAAASLKPFISDDLMVRLISPLQYRPKHGGRTAFGYEATLLPTICEVLLDADKAGELKANQKHLAEMADVMIRGFARVGVIALVDEATGYQEERARDELARILEAYILEEYRPWTKTFPDEFFRQIYRVHGWPYRPGNAKRTPFIGKLINKYVYEPLPPGVLDELRRLNPVTENGRRKRKHFQHLADTGNVEPAGIQIGQHYRDGFLIHETQAAARIRIEKQNAERKERLENLRKLRAKAIELSLSGASPELRELAKEIRRALKGKIANIDLDD